MGKKPKKNQAESSPSKHPEQRVGVFVDVSNLYYSARALYKRKVNFGEVLRVALAGRKLIRAIAYVVTAGGLEEEGFYKALSKAGYEIKSKDLQVFYGGAKKGDWDIGIAMDAIELAPKLDTIIIVSGDGDYIPLVQHLKRAMSCKVEIVAFSKSSSSRLMEEADDFTDLSQSKRFLL